MSRIEDTIEVGVPVSAAYNQWTQFEDFPRFMEGVEQVVQLDDSTLEWTAKIAGREQRWQARITEQTPDRVVAWESTTGATNDGSVTFEPVGTAGSRVHLALDVEPEGPIESAGDALGLVKRRVHGDLERFKAFIEARGAETGSWRGEIHGGTTGESPTTRQGSGGI
jgi:uncharacterized membrane protein